jgi:hypothetical protein
LGERLKRGASEICRSGPGPRRLAKAYMLWRSLGCMAMEMGGRTAGHAWWPEARARGHRSANGSAQTAIPAWPVHSCIPLTLSSWVPAIGLTLHYQINALNKAKTSPLPLAPPAANVDRTCHLSWAIETCLFCDRQGIDVGWPLFSNSASCANHPPPGEGHRLTDNP